MPFRKSILVFVLFVASCQSTPKVETNVHTGDTLYSGSTSNAYSGLMSYLRATPYYSAKFGYGIETAFQNYGWIYIDQAWSFGKQLPYQRDPGDVGACGGGGGCITTENGIVSLTEAEFRKAAQEGFEFQLIGSGGAVTGKLPPERFQEVLNLMTGKR